MPEPLVHTVAEACARLRVGRTKLYELVAQNEIQSIHVGRRVLVTEAALQAYVDRLCSESAASKVAS